MAIMPNLGVSKETWVNCRLLVHSVVYRLPNLELTLRVLRPSFDPKSL